MNIISDLKKLDGLEILHITVLFFAIISSGVLLIYLYKPELLLKLDTIKLILFSIALSSPIYAINFTIVSMDKEVSELSEKSILASIISFVISYFMITISYFFNLLFSTYVVGLIILEILFISTMFLIIKEQKAKL